MENWDEESQTKAKLIEEIKNHLCVYNKADPNHYHQDKMLGDFHQHRENVKHGW